MKVLHLIARMNVGGTARYLTMLDAGLNKSGIESAIATGFVQGAEAEDPSIASVKLHRINYLGRAINPIADHKAFKEFEALVAKENRALGLSVSTMACALFMVLASAGAARFVRCAAL